MGWEKVGEAIGGPVVSGLFGIGGGALQASAASEAAKMQAASAAQALELEKQKEAERQREWEKMLALQEAQWNARQQQLAPYNQLRASIAAKYGVKIPMGSAAYTPPQMPTGWKPGDPIPAATGGAGDTASRLEKVTAGAPLITGDFTHGAAPAVAPKLSLGDLHDWSGSIWAGR